MSPLLNSKISWSTPRLVLNTALRLYTFIYLFFSKRKNTLPRGRRAVNFVGTRVHKRRGLRSPYVYCMFMYTFFSYINCAFAQSHPLQCASDRRSFSARLLRRFRTTFPPKKAGLVVEPRVKNRNKFLYNIIFFGIVRPQRGLVPYRRRVKAPLYARWRVKC